MIITTTPNVDGRNIQTYHGLVFSDVIMFKGSGAGLRNIFVGRSQNYEEELMTAREEVLRKMEERASRLGANAVVGVDINYKVIGTDNSMFMVTCSGTAVTLT